ncbi:MAG: hypothetical protein ACK4ON_08910 [Bacteroidia bacterium]
MKKAIFTLLLLVGISQSMDAASLEVTTRTFRVDYISGNWTIRYTYTYIDFNGNGCLDQWETCVLTSVQYIEDLGVGQRYILE